MQQNNIPWYAMLHALGVLVYVASVALIMNSAEQIFGKMDNYWGPIAFLMLFVLSAAVVGSLVLARPIMLYLDGHKKTAVQLLMMSIGWLFLMTILVFVIQAFI